MKTQVTVKRDRLEPLVRLLELAIKADILPFDSEVHEDSDNLNYEYNLLLAKCDASLKYFQRKLKEKEDGIISSEEEARELMKFLNKEARMDENLTKAVERYKDFKNKENAK